MPRLGGPLHAGNHPDRSAAAATSGRHGTPHGQVYYANSLARFLARIQLFLQRSCPRSVVQQSQRIRLPSFNRRNILLAIVVLFVVRNVVFQDYESAEVKELKKLGYTDRQIQKYLEYQGGSGAKSSSSTDASGMRGRARGKKPGDLESMQKDIDFLMREVYELRKRLDNDRRRFQPPGTKGEGDGTGNGENDDIWQTMDQIHQKKRERRERAMQEQQGENSTEDSAKAHFARGPRFGDYDERIRQARGERAKQKQFLRQREQAKDDKASDK